LEQESIPSALGFLWLNKKSMISFPFAFNAAISVPNVNKSRIALTIQGFNDKVRMVLKQVNWMVSGQ